MNRKTENTDSPTLSIPDGWDKITWDQLVWMYEKGVRKEDEPEIMWRLRVWMELCGLELFGESYYQDGESQQPFLDRDDLGIEEYRQVADCINGKGVSLEDKGPTLACLFRYRRTRIRKLCDSITGHKEKPMGATLTILYEAVKHQTKWLDDPMGLTSIPKEAIWIHGKKYKIPDELLINLTYGQYSNCQHVMQSYWSALEVLTWNEATEESKKRRLKKPSNEQVEAAIKLLIECQNKFVATILTPRRFQILDIKDGLRIHMGYVWAYDSDDAERLAVKLGTSMYVRNEMIGKRVSTTALFGILYRQFQSCLREFHTMYPNLFSGGGGGSEDHPLTIEIGTLNAIMKYAGFTKSEDVYESNAVVIFKWLDSMTKEAKEMERITKKSK